MFKDRACCRDAGDVVDALADSSGGPVLREPLRGVHSTTRPTIDRMHVTRTAGFRSRGADGGQSAPSFARCHSPECLQSGKAAHGVLRRFKLGLVGVAPRSDDRAGKGCGAVGRIGSDEVDREPAGGHRVVEVAEGFLNAGNPGQIAFQPLGMLGEGREELASIAELLGLDPDSVPLVFGQVLQSMKIFAK